MRKEEFLHEYNTSDYENTKLGEAQAFEIMYSRINERKKLRVKPILFSLVYMVFFTNIKK